MERRYLASHLRWGLALIGALVFAGCDTGPDDDVEASRPEAQPHEDADFVVVDDFDGVYVPARISWDSAAGGERDASERLGASFENQGTQPLEVELRVRARTLDGAVENRVLDRAWVEPGNEYEFDLALSDLPVQVVGGPVEYVVTAAMLRDDGSEFSVASDSRYLTFEPGYGRAEIDLVAPGFDYEPEDPRVWETLYGTRARKLDLATGRFVEIQVDRARPMDLQAEIEPQAWNPWLPELPDWFFWPRICMQWSAEFYDSTTLTDYLGASGVQAVPASHAYFRVNAWGTWTRVWEGFLDANGCTPPIDLPAGDYTGRLESRFDRGGGEAQIAVHFPNPSLGYEDALLGTGTGRFTVGTGTHTFASLAHTTASRGAAVVSTLLRSKDMPLPSDVVSGPELTAHMGTQCPSGHAGCFTGAHLYVGTNNDGTDLSRLRHVTGHELGHWLQRRLIPALSTSNYGDWASQAACRCDHVSSANTLHCWNSREFLPTAALEGFAHFFAAKTFNDIDEADCWFQYYKEGLSFGGSVLEPPNLQLCSYPHRWMERKGCAEAGKGVEQDWLGFLWRVHTDSDQRLSMADIIEVFGAASSGGLTTRRLEDAARARLSSGKANYLIESADRFGVNH